MNNNEFINIKNNTLYEVNKRGDVRRCDNQKAVSENNGKVRLIIDGSDKRTTRCVEQLVCAAFFPHLENRRGVLRYMEGVGYVEDKGGSQADDKMLEQLLGNQPDYKIWGRKNYKEEIRFNFKGLVSCDSNAKCIMVNEDDNTLQLYDDEDEAEDYRMNGDEIYYFNVSKGKADLEHNSDLLEHIIMAKFFYLKYKIDEESLNYSEKKIQRLHDKYFSYDCEERFDEFVEELNIHAHPKSSESKVVETRKVKAKNPTGGPMMNDEEKEVYNKQKQIDDCNKRERARIYEEEKMEREIKNRRILEMEAERMEAAVHSTMKQRIRSYNKTFGTSYGDLDSMVAGFKNDVKRNRANKDKIERQKQRDQIKAKKALKYFEEEYPD